MPARLIPVPSVVARLRGLGASATGRLWREASKLPSQEGAILRRLAHEIATDFERAERDLCAGREIEAPDINRANLTPGS